MSDPRVSVIVPVHNSEKYLEECLDSILAQTERDIEVICVDDGSTDSSPEILAGYAERDNRLRIIAQECRGAGAARNRGLAEASGTYLSFLDSDDFFEPEMLETAADKLEATGADVVVFETLIYDETRKANRLATWNLRWASIPSEEPFTWREMQGNVFLAFANCAWNKLFRREFVERNGLRFQEISRANDLFFSCSSIALATGICALRKPLVHYRTATGTSLQATKDRDPLAFWEAVKGLRALLVNRGLYEELESSFLDHALDTITYNADSLKTLEGLEELRALVVEHAEPILGLLKRPAEQFADAAQLSQYRSLCTANLTDYLFWRVKEVMRSREQAYWYNDQNAEAARMLRRELREVQSTKESLNDELERIKASTSFRVGLRLTAPARFLKDRLTQ